MKRDYSGSPLIWRGYVPATILVVRVGCIIEARASQIEIDMNSSSSVKTSTVVSHASLLIENTMASKKKPYLRHYFSNRSIYPGQQLKSTTVTPTSNPLTEDDDSCSGKADGYYPNFGSGCTSYYFCAAGYQITYVCSPNRKFNGKKCEEDYICPTAGHLNLCQSLPNGYYPHPNNSEKYFYCYQRAKVIELSCDKGKVFIGNTCITKAQQIENKAYRKSLLENSCSEKANGFYPDLQSNCVKYYYCISGVKTDLECLNNFIFNGDVCVHSSTYLCPRREELADKDNADVNTSKNYRKSKTSANDTEQSLTISNSLVARKDNEGESTTANYV